MNKPRILALADHIEALPPQAFDMSTWARKTECGTVACIAGWAAQLWPTKELDTALEQYGLEGVHWCGFAAEALELSSDKARRLFLPSGGEMYAGDQRAHAAAVLRHFAETGRVDWRVGAPETPTEEIVI